MARGKECGRIVVEVAYARVDRQTIIELEFEKGATAGQAIAASGILDRYPEIDLKANKTGILGELVGLDRPLRDRDRIEIYRPLPISPAGLRRRHAAAKRSKKPPVRR